MTADMSPTSARFQARSFGGRDSLSVDDARNQRFSPPNSPPPAGAQGPIEYRLYLPIPAARNGQLTAPGQSAPVDLERLVAIRNLFAFLTRQPLVATQANADIYSAFLQISSLLQEFGFTTVDGSSFGEAVNLNFGFYISQMGLADVRYSREKTLEALILSERMKSVELYNEAFAHAVGKYSAIIDIKSPLFERISLDTRQRLERAHLDLVKRLDNVNAKLERFEFPSLFAGTANSTSNPDHRQIRFKAWIRGFERMRGLVLGFYKTSFGNWPPKASSKKNPFSESGLNRLVLKLLYSDLCALYDLIVDRESLTPRVINENPEDAAANDIPTISALRKILSESDHCSPPVLPPVPFDVPLIPSLATIMPNYSQLSPKEQAKAEKKIKEKELGVVLRGAYNRDTNSLQIPFLNEFRDFEMKEARGKSVSDVADQRFGYWLFLYVVIQSLPMLVVDAPNIKFAEAVEYFLCEPPMGNPPWMEESNQVRKVWYEVSRGERFVELSADAVMFSVEAIYHRSHCWLAAKQWEGVNGADIPPPPDAAMSPLEPPRPVFQSLDPMVKSPTSPMGSGTMPPPGPQQMTIRSRDVSPNVRGRLPSRGNQAYRSSIALGIEPVPFAEGPEGYGGELPPRVVGQHGRSSSLGPRPMTSPMNRTISSGNLHAMHHRDSRDSGNLGVESPVATGATFDDILGPQKKMKKKSRFF
jgi:hypothetical protein